MTANMNIRTVPQTSKNTRPCSRINLLQEDSGTVNADLVNFESKMKDSRFMLYKYPNIELKRCFDPKTFRKSN